MKFYLVFILIFGVVALSIQTSPPMRPPPPPPNPLPRNPFTVVAPNTIRRGKNYRVFIRGLDVRFPIDIQIRLVYDNDNSFIKESVRLTPSRTSARFSFDTSDLPAAENGFTFIVTAGRYTDMKYVTYIRKENSIFIQTNKAIFKPFDVVQYRLFSIDSESNAINPSHPVTVTITDPRNNEIEKLEKVKFEKGKYEFMLSLPGRPILGTWTISAKYGEDESVATKTFEVDEYVLSPFTASISAPAVFYYGSTQLPVTIHHEYTFKQPVSGVATVTFTKQNGGTFEKKVDCVGRSTTFYVNIVEDLEFTPSGYYFTQIGMTFVDPKTNTKAIDQTEVSIVPHRYTLEIINDKTYKPGDQLEFTVIAKTLDGKPITSRATITVTVTVTVTINTPLGSITATATITVTLTNERSGSRSGRGTYRIPSEQSESINLQATAEDAAEGFSYAYPVGTLPPEGITLALITENPSFRNCVKILATVADRISSFFYFVTSKGVLLESGRIYMDEDGNRDRNSRTVQFSIDPDFEYAPTMKIYAYYYRSSDAKLFDTTLSVYFKNELPNHLNLNLRKADASGNVVVKPGSRIDLSIDTKPYSTVSLAAIDQRVLQIADNQNFTLNEVMDSFGGYGGFGWWWFRPSLRRRPYSDNYDANWAGLNFFTNIPIEDDMIRRRVAMPSAPASPPPPGVTSGNIRVRKDFREVFLWEDVSVHGRRTISRKVPDSITTYLIYGVSMNEHDGMGLPENLPSATVYLPFFLAFELPTTVKRGETFIFDIQIFNYLRTCQDATITIISDPRFDAWEPHRFGWTVSKGQYLQTVHIDSNEVATVSFGIVPKELGVINIKVSVKSDAAGDAVEKPLRIIPEGIPRTITRSTLIATDGSDIPADKLLQCDLPASAYQDTTEISATVIGDILGKALNNIDKLIVLPTGCGEQNMLGFVSDLAILGYLEATNKLTDALRTKLIQFLTVGYQNQLAYRNAIDGSFSAYPGGPGSFWLTAYVVRHFGAASKYISVDPAIIENGLKFIVEGQKDDGSFDQPGRAIHSQMQGNVVANTAFIVNMFRNTVLTYAPAANALVKATQYLEAQLGAVTDTYTYAIVATALHKYESGTTAFNAFYARRIEKPPGDPIEIYWSVPSDSNWYGSRSLDVEVSAYGLDLLLLRKNFYNDVELTTALKVARYLMSQVNPYGGFSSTQDTVVALTALANFARVYSVGAPNVELVLTTNIGDLFTVYVTPANAMTLQTYGLTTPVRELNVHVNEGSTGLAIVSLVCNFYENPQMIEPSFLITTTYDLTCQWRSELQICSKPVSGKPTSMIIVEVRMPSGYYYYNAWWLQTNPNVGKVETFEDNTIVVFYFDEFNSDWNCVSLGVGKAFKVENLKPGFISVNSYYDTSKQGSVEFVFEPRDIVSC